MTGPSILPHFHALRPVALLVASALLLPASSSFDAIAADPRGSTSEQNKKTQWDLAQTRLQILQELRYRELELEKMQSALDAAKDARSKAMHQAELEAMTAKRDRLRVQLAANQLSTDALHAPPDVRKRIDELAKQTMDLKAKSAVEFAARLRDAKTIRTVGQLLVAAEHLRQIGKSDAAARVSREAELLEREFKEDKP